MLRIVTWLLLSLFRIDLKLSMLGICWENNLPALLEKVEEVFLELYSVT